MTNPMGTLRCAISAGPMAAEHERLLRGLLARKEDAPELQAGETLDGTYSDRAKEIAILNWRQRMVHEHRSAQTFANLLPLLMEAEAPLDFKTVALRSSMDELRHAALCGQIVALLGGEPTAKASLQPEPPTLHPDVTPVEQALRNMAFVGCISETVAVGLLTEERDMSSEPIVRRVLTQLLGDETLHARIGWAYLRDVWPTLNAEQQARTSDYIGRALGYYEHCIIASTIPGQFDDALLAEGRALGFSEPTNAKSLAKQAIEEVVLPELEAVGVQVRAIWEARHCPA